MTSEPVGAEAPLQAGSSGVAFNSSGRPLTSKSVKPSVQSKAPAETRLPNSAKATASPKAAGSAQATGAHKEITPSTVKTLEASPEDFTAAARAAARAAFPQEAQALEQEALDLEQGVVNSHTPRPEHFIAASFLLLIYGASLLPF